MVKVNSILPPRSHTDGAGDVHACVGFLYRFGCKICTNTLRPCNGSSSGEICRSWHGVNGKETFLRELHLAAKANRAVFRPSSFKSNAYFMVISTQNT